MFFLSEILKKEKNDEEQAKEIYLFVFPITQWNSQTIKGIYISIWSCFLFPAPFVDLFLRLDSAVPWDLFLFLPCIMAGRITIKTTFILELGDNYKDNNSNNSICKNNDKRYNKDINSGEHRLVNRENKAMKTSTKIHIILLRI